MTKPLAKTVTVLFTEILGSTPLWEQNTEAMPIALARCNTLLREAATTYNATAFKTIGDTGYAIFVTAPDALAAAIMAQRALHHEPWTITDPLRVRIALHTGVVEEYDSDYFGFALNRAARLLASGHGGQVLLSSTTQELVQDQLPPSIFLRDLGEHRLKDLFRPEHIFQLVAPDLPVDFPSLNTLDLRPTNLPIQATPFIGREREIAAVCTMLRRPEVRMLTLTGSGGTGKTRLALQAGAELLEDFADGVYFVALAALNDSTLVDSETAHALGISEAGNQPFRHLLHNYLRDKHVLLILDNYEQVLEAAPMVTDLLNAAPRLKVLITSRIILHLYGEHEYVVPPLVLPDLKNLPPLDSLIQYESIRLFIERAGAAKTNFAVTDENASIVSEICVRLDGLPLAIELAAARSKLFDPQALLTRLTSRLSLLTGGARDLPMRQQTLRNTITWSYNLLDTDEQTLFRRLAVFAGGCTLEAVEAVCSLSEKLPPRLGHARPLHALDRLASLVDKSLLRQITQVSVEPRFGMLETIHEYASEQLQESAEAEALRRNHAGYYLALVEAAEPELKGPQQQRWLKHLEEEHDNLRLVLRWALEQEEIETAARLIGALWRFWMVRGHLSEGREWMERVFVRRSTLSSVVQAKVVTGAGVLAWLQSDNTYANTLFEESLTIYRELSDKPNIGRALSRLGASALDRGDYARATQLLEESLALCRELGDKQGIAMTLTNLGATKLGQRDYVQARPLIEEALALDLELGDQRDVANNLINLGQVALAEGDPAQAHQLFEESLALNEKIGDREQTAECLEGLAGVAQAYGQSEWAARLFGTAQALRDAIGAPLLPLERALYERYLVAAHTHLGDVGFAAAWADGQAMTPEQALTALQEVVLPEQVPISVNTSTPPSYPAGLTEREVEVLRLVAQGLTNAQVAKQLILSTHTVNVHLRSIYSKIGVKTRTAAARFATDNHLI